MRNILVLGAGRSATVLIDYLIDHAPQGHWTVTVADMDAATAIRKVGGRAHAKAVGADLSDRAVRLGLMQGMDVVVSLLPPPMHPEVAKDCLTVGCHMATASYVSDAMRALHHEAAAKGLTFINEIGLDPGIDHLSAMQMLDALRADGHRILHFESHCGGLVAPESDDNPWGYKFTWNPRNVVLAGQGGAAKFIHNGTYRYIPYQRLFSRIDQIWIDGYGSFEGYANRDSLGYREAYGLNDALTVFRGTLRKEGFCAAWNVFVQLGMTDDTYTMEGTDRMTLSGFLGAFLPDNGASLRYRLADHLCVSDRVMDQIDWLGLFGDEPVGLAHATPAQILQSVLERKWAMRPTDKDMIVMWHRIGSMKDGVEHTTTASLVVKGDDTERTAMAKTVGLPLAIATRMVLEGTIARKGVLLPIYPDIYGPMLAELQRFGIRFEERMVTAA
jgi:saccharopine dehydrogenase-like NADP-dependent oxidoreductase